MIYEFAKKLVWNMFYRGDLTATERDDDLQQMEENQMKEIPVNPSGVQDQLLRLEVWRNN